MRPYQRTASGPDGERDRIEVRVDQHAGGDYRARRRACCDELAGRAAERASAPGEPEVEPRVRVGDLAVDDAAPTEVRDRSWDHGDAEPARDEAHDGLHLNRLLRDPWRISGAGGERGDDVVEAGRDRARDHDEGIVGQLAHRDAADGAREAVARGQGRHEALALHDEVIQFRGHDWRQQQAEIELPRRKRGRLIGGQHFAQCELDARPRRLVGLEQARQHAVVGERDEAEAQAPACAGGHAPHLQHRALELREQPLGFVQKARAFGRELDAAPRAREQRRAEARFQVADRARQRRLRDVQRLRRAPEMQPLGDRDEVAQLAQVRRTHIKKVSIIDIYCIGLDL